MREIKIELKDKIYRYIWTITYSTLFRHSPIIFFKWRVILLKLFGAKISWSARIYPSCKIWSPKNLEIGKLSCISHNVNIYNVGIVKIKNKTIISQDTVLCTATKKYIHQSRKLLVGEIFIDNNCWIASDVFIGPDVSIGYESVILARVTLLKSVGSKIKVKIKDENEYCRR